MFIDENVGIFSLGFDTPVLSASQPYFVSISIAQSSRHSEQVNFGLFSVDILVTLESEVSLFFRFACPFCPSFRWRSF